MGLTAMQFIEENYTNNERVCFGLNAYNIKTIEQVKYFSFGIESDWLSDEYMSVSTVLPYARTRSLENIDHIKFFTADLDIWHDNTQYQDMSVEQVLSLMESDIFAGGKIVRPDYIFFTGRGFLLLWRVYKSNGADLTRHDAPNWIKIQQEIAKVFSEYYIDSACVSDYSRVFRILGSINSKSNERVRFLQGERKGSTLKEWIAWSGIEKITDKQQSLLSKMYQKGIQPVYPIRTRRQASEFIQKNKETYAKFCCCPASEKQLLMCRSLSRKYHVPLPDDLESSSAAASDFISTYRNTSQNFNDGLGVFHICMKIIESFFRQENNIIGKRERLLWIYRICHFAMYQDETASLSAVLSLNDLISIPLSRREIEHATRSAISGNYNDYVCCHLTRTFPGMSFAQLKEKYYQRGTMSKQERRQYDKSRYATKLQAQNRISKQEAIRIRRERVLSLLASGNTQQEIADLLGVSLRTIKGDCSALKSKGAKISNHIILREASSLESSVTEKSDTCQKVDISNETMPSASDSVPHRALTTLFIQNNAQNFSFGRIFMYFCAYSDACCLTLGDSLSICRTVDAEVFARDSVSQSACISLDESRLPVSTKSMYAPIGDAIITLYKDVLNTAGFHFTMLLDGSKSGREVGLSKKLRPADGSSV